MQPQATAGRTGVTPEKTRATEHEAELVAAIEQHYPRLYGYARFRLGPDDAQDAVGAALEKVWRTRDRFDPGRGDADAWVYAVGINAIRDEVRHQHRQPALATAQPDDLVAPASADDRATVIAALQAIRELGQRDADLMALRFGAGLSIGEVAERVGRTPGAVAVAIHRALARVRRQMADE